MKPEDKQRLKDAFTNAINKSPYADEIVEGIVTNEGEKMSRRKLVELTVASEEFYKVVGDAIDRGVTTLDRVISQFEQGASQPSRRPPQP